MVKFSSFLHLSTKVDVKINLITVQYVTKMMKSLETDEPRAISQRKYLPNTEVLQLARNERMIAPFGRISKNIAILLRLNSEV